jgi:hypothetical protein
MTLLPWNCTKLNERIPKESNPLIRSDTYNRGRSFMQTGGDLPITCSVQSGRDSQAFFSWLGTLPYLTHEAIIRTLESLAASSAAGSEVVFDYRVLMEFIDLQDVPIVEAADKATAAAGEVKRSFLNPQTFLNEVST